MSMNAFVFCQKLQKKRVTEIATTHLNMIWKFCLFQNKNVSLLLLSTFKGIVLLIKKKIIIWKWQSWQHKQLLEHNRLGIVNLIFLLVVCHQNLKALMKKKKKKKSQELEVQIKRITSGCLNVKSLIEFDKSQKTTYSPGTLSSPDFTISHIHTKLWRPRRHTFVLANEQRCF